MSLPILVLTKLWGIKLLSDKGLQTWFLETFDLELATHAWYYLNLITVILLSR